MVNPKWQKGMVMLSKYGQCIMGAVLTLLWCSMVHAAVYQSEDENGTIIFSDKPFPNAVPYTLKPITIISGQEIKRRLNSAEQIRNPAPSVPNTATEATDASASVAVSPILPPKRVTLEILSPTPNQALLMLETHLTAKVRTLPALSGQERVIFLVNDQVVGSGESVTILLERIGPGEHRLEARVLDKQDRILARQTTVFYVLLPVGAASAEK